MNFSSVKQRLYAGFALLALVTLISCAIGIYLFQSLHRQTLEITRDEVPAMRLVLRIAKESQRVVTLVSQLQSDSRSSSYQTLLTTLRRQWLALRELSQQFSELHGNQDNAGDLLLRSGLMDTVITRLPELNETVQRSIDANNRRRAILAQLHDLGSRLNAQLYQQQAQLNAGIYQLGELRTEPQRLQLLHRQHRALNHYLDSANRLQLLLETAANQNRAQLDALQSRAQAQLDSLETALLPLQDDALVMARLWQRALGAAISGNDSLLEARARELAAFERRQNSLQQHGEIAEGIMQEAEKWVQNLHDGINQSASSLAQQIHSYTLLLLLATLLFLLLIFSIVWLYVGRSIILPLIATSHAMNAIAEGRTDTPIPRFGEGEIGLMLKSLARLRAYVDQVKNQAQRDGLTGLYNRRQFDETLQRELRRAAREQIPISLILADIDHFKSYNDNYGHIAGDNCLRAVAQVLDRHFNRAADLCARYGGEEFAVVLPGSDVNAAELLAEGLVAQVETLRLPHQHSPTAACITISVGVVVLLPDQTHTPERVVELADKALYKAKAGGRNRLVLNDLSDRFTASGAVRHDSDGQPHAW